MNTTQMTAPTRVYLSSTCEWKVMAYFKCVDCGMTHLGHAKE